MDHTITFDAPARDVHADLISREFWDNLMAAYSWVTDLSEVTRFHRGRSGTDISFKQLLPRTHLPPVARSVMPVDMVITREQHIDPFDRAEGRADGSYRATVPHGPGYLRGECTLTDQPCGSQLRLVTVCKVNIPLVGGTLEQLILSHIPTLFDAEGAFLADWLGKRH